MRTYTRIAGHLARVGSGVFLVIQMVILLDFVQVRMTVALAACSAFQLGCIFLTA